MNDVTISADGIPIHYEVHGKGTPTLVFVHGWCCDRSYWEKQVNHFGQQYKVVAVDLAGHGESGLGRKTWTISAFGEDVVAVVEKLDLKPVVLIGHSMGGEVIVEAARRISKRVTGLVGVDTFRRVGPMRKEQIDDFLSPFRANFAEAARNFVRRMFVSNSDSALVEKIVEDMSAAPPDVGVGAGEELLNTDLKADLQEMKAPIVVINSDYRPTDVEAAQKYGIEVVFMSGVGHFVMLEDAETFNHLLDEAVKRFAHDKVSE